MLTLQLCPAEESRVGWPSPLWQDLTGQFSGPVHRPTCEPGFRQSSSLLLPPGHLRNQPDLVEFALVRSHPKKYRTLLIFDYFWPTQMAIFKWFDLIQLIRSVLQIGAEGQKGVKDMSIKDNPNK